ncbi:response regulator [Polyangium fumosum]|uniref:Response regulator n=1 Tax=Polyangium fumosum TaxID=889272 RepID=A0A4U1JHN3_9BACT|nr:response regulator [Polyangium fumosum]TKD10221.1 response regulator [Polyangium fumosum]
MTEDAATLLADMIRAQGWSVAVAVNGPQALSMLASFAPDATVLGIGLPVMDGPSSHGAPTCSSL